MDGEALGGVDHMPLRDAVEQRALDPCRQREPAGLGEWRVRGARRSSAAPTSRVSSRADWRRASKSASDCVGLFGGDVAALDERLGVEGAHRAVLLDLLVHDRLRVARVVALVVAVPAVADEVDDDVLVERLAEGEGEPRDPHARLLGRPRSRGRSAPAPSSRRRSGRPTSAPRCGGVVKPSWLLMTRWTVPPVR